VHLIRNSLDYATWKDRKALAAALRPIYAAPSAEAALAALMPSKTANGGRNSRPWWRPGCLTEASD
jgi:transposase-like protein